jgi:hypothetical protein
LWDLSFLCLCGNTISDITTPLYWLPALNPVKRL